MSALAGLVEKGLMAPDWAEALAPVDDRIAAMGRFLRDEPAYLPAGDRVFAAFQRRDDLSTTGSPGVGLGLAIARGFTEAMDGSVALEDTPGGGLTVVIALPVADPEAVGKAYLANSANAASPASSAPHDG